MRIAIDGPAGSGKSTLAHALAQRLNLTLLDTGAMYRSVTLACLQKGVDLEDNDAVAQVAREVRIEFMSQDDKTQRVLLDGEDVTAAIRTPQVDAAVPTVSAIPAVREAMVEEQRRIGSAGNVVAEGRDIGTVVFPDAEVKVFLTADMSARAHRRAQQSSIDDPAREQEILDALKKRDEIDSTREAAPLVAAEDAHHLDSSNMTVEQEVEAVVALVEKARAAGGVQAEPPVQNEPAKQESAVPVAKPKPTTAKKKNDDKRTGPMRLFARHEPEEYYEHPVREFPVTSRALLGAAILVCAGISKVLWPWKVENGKTLWKAEGGQVVVMNHVSMLDPVVIMVTEWTHGRRMRPIYKSEFDGHKIVNWFFARIGGIPVERGTADVKAVRRAQRALQRGEDVLIFPEGTRVYSDDQEVEIHAGFALMAQLAKAPVLPVAIVGARDGAPGGNKPLRPGRVWLGVGEPITFDQIAEKGRKKQAKAMEKRAMERVYALRDALRAAHPGKM